MDNLSWTIPSFLAGFVLMALLVPSLGQGSEPSQSEQELRDSLVARMDNVQQKLADVTNSAEKMQSEVDKAIFDCLGTHSELCEAMELESDLAEQMGLQSYWSPGKRASGETPQTNSLYQELQRKRAVVQHLNGLLRGAHGVLKEERKRSCQVNLGFPCDTSRYMEVARMLDYLKKPGSPGKKRSVVRRR
ncbi:hypothetical protein RRG08_025169 [Elysia crispata]|uniref:Uncharacterized protein n=1 Tax=Elysia crispata TaxID=231223 RepID=A0AAE1DE83_9GAST|nr:hypothetical protein RRG08_025169 [Elysia crispata]